MNTKCVTDFVTAKWTDDVIPKLCEYIKIPNLSPSFDKEVLTNGHQDRAMELLVNWVKAQCVPGLSFSLERLPGRTPLLFMEVPAYNCDVKQVGTVLLYGHMDKQPPFDGWNEGLGPYTPVIKDGRLYGRGGADDGYSIFCAITAIMALKQQNLPHARYVIIIEACEESGSPDLPFYIEKLKSKIGTPNLVICLDSGCGNYEQLWVTNSLRGIVVGTLTVELLREGVHSGDASGVVPDTFRIARQLLSRLEDETSGQILPEGLSVEVSDSIRQKVQATAQVLGQEGMVTLFPFIGDAMPVAGSLFELALNRWWRPQLAVVGAAGLPDPSCAGNVLRPSTSLTLSLRIPPTLDAAAAKQVLQELFSKNLPYNAKVTWDVTKSGMSWKHTPHRASNTFYGKPAVYQGEGGSIPFMGMLGKLFPSAQFLITGVLGPASNAHGPNEMIDIQYSAKLTCCITSVLADHAATRVEELNDGAVAEPAAKKAKTLVKEYGREADGSKI